MASPVLGQHWDGVPVLQGDSVVGAYRPADAAAKALEFVDVTLLEGGRVADGTEVAQLHAVSAAVTALPVDTGYVLRLKELPQAKSQAILKFQAVTGGAVAEDIGKGGDHGPYGVDQAVAVMLL